MTFNRNGFHVVVRVTPQNKRMEKQKANKCSGCHGADFGVLIGGDFDAIVKISLRIILFPLPHCRKCSTVAFHVCADRSGLGQNRIRLERTKQQLQSTLRSRRS